MPSHGCFSTNWNSGEVGSKRHTITSEMAKVTSVVHIATQRAVPLASAVVAAHQHDEQRAEQRQEGDDRENGPIDIH